MTQKLVLYVFALNKISVYGTSGIPGSIYSYLLKIKQQIFVKNLSSINQNINILCA